FEDIAKLKAGVVKVRSMIRISAVISVLLIGSALAGALPQAGQTPQATMNISGAVTVNGRPAAQPSAIFPGDVIQTGPSSFATIVSEELEITVPQNSSLTFSRDTVNLGCGSSSVFTKAGTSILRTQDGATITPTAADGFNRIEVTQGGGIALIRVILGSALVARGDQTTPLRSGAQLEVPATACPTPYAAPQTSSTGGGAAPAGQATGASGSMVPILIGVGGGGAAAAVLLSRSGDDEPVSPVRP
ncbi:MAG: hypothetical protein AB7O65_02840, partial [Candidatus Korobacteraceae bacterium]